MAKKTDVIDLSDLSNEQSPTLAETLYAQRLAAGLHDMPDEGELSAGTKVELANIKANKLAEVAEPVNSGDTADMPNGRDLVNQMLGQIQMANSFARFADVVSLQKLKYIKDNKIYRSVAGVSMVSSFDGEKIADVGTWSGFCKALGLSVSKIDEDLLNLNAFGEAALKQLASIGAGYRELRQYRKLPDDEKTALIEAAKSGDKDQLLELAETLIEKHIAEKAQLTDKAKELEQDLADSGKRINNMNAEIERQALKLERLGDKKSRITTFEERTEEVRDECMHLQAGIELNLNSIQMLFENLNAEDMSSPEYRLRLEQVWVAASVSASRALCVLERLRAISMIEDLPDNIQGQHILTPAEAQRWALDAPMIESRHSAEKLSREVKREADKPKGRGRPSGSKNKAE